MQVDRNLILVGGIDSGKQNLQDIIIGQVDSRIDCNGREVRLLNSCLRIFETSSQNGDFSLNVLRSGTSTCFIVVIDITKGIEFINELGRLKELSEFLAKSSYSLFGNCLVAFTQTDMLATGDDKQQLVDREFGEILFLVDRRFMFINSTRMTQENRNRVVDEFLQLSKPVLRVLCYGNNNIESDKFQLDVSEENTRNIPYHISIHRPPDLNLFNEISQTVSTPELIRLIGQPDQIGTGVSVFLILISLNSVFSTPMLDLITDIPNLLGLTNECSEYFWSRAVIVFDTCGHLNPEETIRLSIEGNDGIKNIIRKAGGRKIYLPQSNTDLLNALLIQFHKIKEKNLHTEFIGGRDVNRRAIDNRNVGNNAIIRLINVASYLSKNIFRKQKFNFIALMMTCVFGRLGLIKSRQYIVVSLMAEFHAKLL
ncbi:hypothetical protein LOD99_9493 [Oopsacas minuta]|uniref:Uncharacterized protein n=1 Tax=Oopsacas minuta TaxID=111878 RepID=A0AAV7JBM3_9METZ|nr:hypothetical protein LOD99_9493 [Oopsacas minuta]